jgi:SPP1 family predicted phage head-tail adaptor
MAILAGRMNKRVVLQTVSNSSDGGGGVTETWADTATLWAQIEELSGSESFEAQQVASRLSHEVKIRYRASVTPQQRFKYGTRILKIRAIKNTGQRNEELVIGCEEEDI